MKRAVLFLWNENVVAVLLSSVSFCVYLITMGRSVGFTDSGELAAVVCTLGIAHPTGYPLLTLLGRSWSMLPFHMEEIIQLNVLSAMLTAMAVGVFFKTSLVLHRSAMVFQQKYRKQKETNNRIFVLASAIASMILGFSTTFWSQSTAFEVYALHLVMILLTIWTFIKGVEEQLTERDYVSRKFILFMFVLGLSFANHMTTVLLGPGFLWLYFYSFGFRREAFLRLFKTLPFFLLGLSIYMYLLIRSASQPLFDWGHPATLERLFWHMSGKQFRVWMFSGWNVVQKQLNYYISNFTSEFSFLVIACIVLGAIILFRQSRRLFTFLALLFGATIVYSVNYDIFDIGSYFLLSYLVIGWVTAYGILFIFNRGEGQRPWMKGILVAVLLMIPLIQMVMNWNSVDETENRLPQQFVHESFSHFEPNAVVLASQWDYFISPALYYQFIRHERSDVTVIDKSLLQNRSWYFLQLERQAPWLIERTREKINLFLTELNKFEHDVPFQFNIIQAHWQSLLTEIVEQSLPDHPVYIDGRIEKEFAPAYHRIPAGLFLRFTKTEDTTCYRTALAPFSVWDKKQPVVKDFEQYYITMLLREAEWLLRYGRPNGAKDVLEEVLRVEPGNFSALWLMKRVGNG